MRKSATEVRKEGWLYRESGYVGGLVNPRYGAIYPHALVTFRCVAVSANSFGRCSALHHCGTQPTVPFGNCRLIVLSCALVQLEHHAERFLHAMNLRRRLWQTNGPS